MKWWQIRQRDADLERELRADLELEDPASFVQVFPRYEGWFAGAAQVSTFNSEDFDAIRTQTRSLSDVAAWSRNQITLDDLRKQDSSLLVTCNYFQVFGIDRVVMGRFFLPIECGPGAEARVTVISEHLWRDSYAADPQIIGKIIHISRQPFVVIGIVADDDSANVVAGSVWIPYTLLRPLQWRRNLHGQANRRGREGARSRSGRDRLYNVEFP